jgi:HAD superfamily phosphatase (TIGR01668 family)
LRLPLLIPDIRLNSVFELTPELLKAKNIRLLFLDLDNTLSKYGNGEPSGELRAWLDMIRGAGIKPFILSNNRGARPENFAGVLDVKFAGKAKKPNPKALLEILREQGYKKSEAALAGDQIFTDILCAKRGGILAVAVKPISIKAPQRALRYALETPFRMLCRDKPAKGRKQCL